MATLRLIHCLYLNITLFVLGIVGVVLNRKSVLLTLMAIEVILLSISLNFITSSIFFKGTIVGLILLVVILGVSRLTGGRSEKSKNQAAFKQLSRTTRIY